MLTALVRYTDDAAGLEKTLRFFQGLCTIVIGLLSLNARAEVAAPWIQARSQLNLGMLYDTKAINVRNLYADYSDIQVAAIFAS